MWDRAEVELSSDEIDRRFREVSQLLKLSLSLAEAELEEGEPRRDVMLYDALKFARIRPAQGPCRLREGDPRASLGEGFYVQYQRDGLWEFMGVTRGEALRGFLAGR